MCVAGRLSFSMEPEPFRAPYRDSKSIKKSRFAGEYATVGTRFNREK